MKTSAQTLTAVTVTLVALLAPAYASAQTSRSKTRKETAARPSSESASKEATVAGTKRVQYSAQDVVGIRTKVRFSTLLVLPADEVVMDFTVGDKDLWVVEGNHNFVYIKPAQVAAKTNLNLVTASGNVYSFLLQEVSESPSAAPDLKVLVELSDEHMSAATNQPPRFFAAHDLDACRADLTRAQEETRQAVDAKAAAKSEGVLEFVTNVRFAYRFEAGKKPFYVRAMYHDDRFTYIQARPEETPTLYEVQDGKPNLITFQYKDGVYIATKIIDQGYLAVGKKRLPFRREE